MGRFLFRAFQSEMELNWCILLLQTNLSLAASFWGISLLSAFVLLRRVKLASVSIFHSYRSQRWRQVNQSQFINRESSFEFLTHHQSWKCKNKSYRRNVATWKQVKRETRTVASYNYNTKICEAKRLTFPEPYKPQPLLRKPAHGSGLRKALFFLG